MKAVSIACDSWLIMTGHVYDVTDFLDVSAHLYPTPARCHGKACRLIMQEHPGGAEIIMYVFVLSPWPSWNMPGNRDLRVPSNKVASQGEEMIETVR